MDTILREKLIYRYVQAMDKGGIEKIAIVLEAALNDQELDRYQWCKRHKGKYNDTKRSKEIADSYGGYLGEKSKRPGDCKKAWPWRLLCRLGEWAKRLDRLRRREKGIYSLVYSSQSRGPIAKWIIINLKK